MSAVLAEAALHPALDSVHQRARAAGLPYAGSVPPAEAWALVQRGRGHPGGRALGRGALPRPALGAG